MKTETKVIQLRPKYFHPVPEVIKFEVGNIYTMSFIGDSDLKPKWICVKRTAKTATFEQFKETNPESITRKIRVYNGEEYILEGTYSMAPSIHARRVAG